VTVAPHRIRYHLLKALIHGPADVEPPTCPRLARKRWFGINAVENQLPQTGRILIACGKNQESGTGDVRRRKGGAAVKLVPSADIGRQYIYSWRR